MPRIYSTYTESDLMVLEEVAEDYGFSASAFQRYCTDLVISQKTNTINRSQLFIQMISTLQTLEPNAIFTVPRLLPDTWSTLTREDKLSLAIQLKLYIAAHPEKYEIAKKIDGQVNQNDFENNLFNTTTTPSFKIARFFARLLFGILPIRPCPRSTTRHRKASPRFLKNQTTPYSYPKIANYRP